VSNNRPTSGFPIKILKINKNSFQGRKEKNEDENLVTISFGSAHACVFLMLRAVLLLEGPPVFHIVQAYKKIGHIISVDHGILYLYLLNREKKD
jgi:hypothetical protein